MGRAFSGGKGAEAAANSPGGQQKSDVHAAKNGKADSLKKKE